MPAQKPDWAGRTVCCIASGPSLTQEDCDAVREAGLTTVVVNSSFRLALWADVLFAFDAKWWRYVNEAGETYLDEARRTFKGRLLVGSQWGERLGIDCLWANNWMHFTPNSGAAAISMAIGAGAKRVLLLGYDCQISEGRKHWHADHPKGSNCASIRNWPGIMKAMSKHAAAKRVEVINCSRSTALTCFPRAHLEAQLPRVLEAA